MNDDEKKTVPGWQTSACLVVFGMLLIGMAATANLAGQAIVSGIGLLAGINVFTRRPNWRPIFPRAIVLYAVVLAFAIYFAMQYGREQPFVMGVCPPDSSLEASTALIFPLLTLLVLGIVGFTCFGIAEIAHDQAFFPVRSVRFAKVALAVVSIALLVGAVGRATRLPPPEKYVESLPILGTLAPPTGKPTRMLEKVAYVPSSMPRAIHLKVYEFALTPNIVTRRYCDDSNTCSLIIRASRGDNKVDDENLRNPALAGVWNFLPQACPEGSVLISKTNSILVREDKQHKLLFVDLVGFDTRYAVDAKTFKFRAVPKQEILDATSVPYAVIGIAFLGLLGALGLEIYRLRARSRLHLIRNAPAGTLGEDGWIVMENGSPSLRIDNSSTISPGPALVLQMESSGAELGPYRRGTIAENSEILFGTRDEILHREKWMLQSPADSLSLTVLLLSVIPLVTYWFAN